METQDDTLKIGSWLKIGGWRVERDLLQIRRGEIAHRLEPQGMRLLVFLAEQAPRVVSREEIFDAVWDGRSVVDETLTRSIYLLRQALGDDAKRPLFIETIPTKGYRLIAEVERGSTPSRGAAVSDPPPPQPVSRRRLWLLLGLLAVIFMAMVLARPWWQTPAVFEGGSASDVGGSLAGDEVRPAIAVLPFDNLSGDARDTYLAEGLTEELIHQLAGIAGLKVVSRSSSMRFRGTDEPPTVIAGKLGVDFLLVGSVLVVEDRARISAQLLGLEGAESLFSRSYDRDLEGILAMLRDVAGDVARETQVRLTLKERRRLESDATVDPEAYRLYLQGLYAIRRRTPEDFRLAEQLLNRAVKEAPEFALAWATLADAQLLSFQYQLQGSSLERARETLDRVLDLDSERAQAHTALGLLHVLDDQSWALAEAAYLRALALEPSDATAYRRYSEMLALSGRYEEAVEQAKRAVELDPLSPLAHATYGHRLSSAKRYSAAVRELETADELGASFTWHLRELSHVLTRLGDEAGAAEARRRDIAGLGASEAELAVLDEAIAEAGLEGYWSWRRQSLLELSNPIPFQVAEACAGLGQKDEALRWLGEAIETDTVWFLHGQRSPAFDRLREDPRYLELVHGLPLWHP